MQRPSLQLSHLNSFNMRAIIVLSVPNDSLSEETREALKKSIPDSIALLLVEETANHEKWGITIIHDEHTKITKL